MNSLKPSNAVFVGLLGVAILACLPSSYLSRGEAQGRGGGAGGGGAGGAGAGGGGAGGLLLGGGGGGAGGANGIIIDAQGVLRNEVFKDPNGNLQRERALAARAKLDNRVAAKSRLRKVSLNRLEAAIRDGLAKRQMPTEEMLCMAGLTRVQHVFYYPDTQDIVLAGPAEAWMTDLAGRVRGMETGWTTLQLQDLIVALRAFPPADRRDTVIQVSIDPTPEGLAHMQLFLRQWGSGATPKQTGIIVEGLRNSLGLQTIRVEGVPPNTHFAQVLIEADYRMKLIGIGLERPPVKIKSYVDATNPAQVSRNALQRWYFVPDYQCVRVTADKLGMELIGNGVKLVGEDQVVSATGGRAVSGLTNKASQTFVSGFTQKYAELAIAVPVYAELRNCVDLAIAAAFIQQNDYYSKANWDQGVLAQEQTCAVEILNTPQHTETVVASVWRGNQLMTPVGGGVTLHPREALQASNLQPDQDGKLSQTRDAVKIEGLVPSQWWWD